MSMVNNLAKNLRDYAKEYNYLSNHTKDRNVPDLLLVAAETIEELSAKVARQNMERSSQYYGENKKIFRDKDEVLIRGTVSQGALRGFSSIDNGAKCGSKYFVELLDQPDGGVWVSEENVYPLPPKYELEKKKLTKYDSPFCNEIEK